MLDELNELYQQAILDHSRHPRFFGALTPCDRTAQKDNPLCGDRYKIFLQVQDDRITRIQFEGVGCAVSKAAGSLLCVTLNGQSIAEARQIADHFVAMVNSGITTDLRLADLKPLAGVHRFPARIKCALLPWEALLQALDQK